MLLSIVTTLYNSAPHLAEFHERISKCAHELTSDYELIFVNDGSPDHSLELALSIKEKDERVKIIDQPYTPTSSSNMPALYFILGGLVGGLLLGIGLAILLEISDSSLRYRSQLETITGVPVFGRIPAY